jgi:dolichyl-diphosphooligosaccharide--protein glycosyltransferase
MADQGFYAFLNWFDDRAWYPLGRNVGQTVYFGLLHTASVLYWVANLLNISLNIRNACIYVGPLFAGLTAVSTYMFTTQVTRRPSAGLLAGAMVAIVPSYISRSGAGGYDNEAVAIFALINTFWLWVTAVDTGSLFWSALTALSYAYMVAAWGGYIFIANMIPIHVLVLIAAGRYSPRLYTAYSTFYILGSLMAIQVPFVNFNIVTAAENAATHGVFVVVQAYAVLVFLRDMVSAKSLQTLFVRVGILVVGGTAAVLIGLQMTGKVQWTGRSLTLLDPSYAKKYLPIIASVSEHQPTTWSSFYFDLCVSVALAPAGLFFLYRDVTDATIFAILYGSMAWYFAGVMIRLMLTLAPIAVVLAAVAVSELLHRFGNDFLIGIGFRKLPPGEDVNVARLRVPVAAAGIMTLTSLLIFFSLHSTFVAHEAYSGSSITIASRGARGERVILDDFREAYFWLQNNTPQDAKIMSWWDYGYQTSQLANRTTIVDNNTANNTHIACVGRAMASSEKDAYPIMQSLDVDYVLVLFGGVAGYSSDDINKFLWMVRIGGGVFPVIQEADYFAEGQYRMDAGGAPAMLNSLMYRLSYYRFGELQTQMGRPPGFDRVRNVEVGVKNIVLEHLDEAFTSENWIVRIFKVRKPANRPVGYHLQNRPQKKGQAQKTQSAQQAPEVTPPKYLGCVSSEAAFGNDRVYGGGPAGAYLKLAQHEAVTKGMKYFAVARGGADGHSFSFSKAPSKFDVSSAGCQRTCLDLQDMPCGCTDGACSELGDKPVPPEENNRRWVVYAV